jgi:hypothetical protein
VEIVLFKKILMLTGILVIVIVVVIVIVIVIVIIIIIIIGIGIGIFIVIVIGIVIVIITFTFQTDLDFGKAPDGILVNLDRSTRVVVVTVARTAERPNSGKGLVS